MEKGTEAKAVHGDRPLEFAAMGAAGGRRAEDSHLKLAVFFPINGMRTAAPREL